MFIDTHTHLFVEEFDSDWQETIERAHAAGVEKLLMPNIDDTTVERMLQVCESDANCYPMIGLHPTSVDETWKERLQHIREWLEKKTSFVAIGEVGMDLYWDTTYCEAQKEVFRTQIEWALEYQLPLVIHCRNAHDEMLEVMEPYKHQGLKGIFHSFTGTLDEARRLLEYEGFMLGINGVLTFKKSTLPEVLKHIPLERLVLETDSPYLAPVPFRGKRNESAYLTRVAEVLSGVYSVKIEEIEEKTAKNALKVFQMIR